MYHGYLKIWEGQTAKVNDFSPYPWITCPPHEDGHDVTVRGFFAACGVDRELNNVGVSIQNCCSLIAPVSALLRSDFLSTPPVLHDTSGRGYNIYMTRLPHGGCSFAVYYDGHEIIQQPQGLIFSHCPEDKANIVTLERFVVVPSLRRQGHASVILDRLCKVRHTYTSTLFLFLSLSLSLSVGCKNHVFERCSRPMRVIWS